VSNPEPAGTSLQILPTGTYDDFPEDGITVDLGPELRKRIHDVAAEKCKAQTFTQECQNALTEVLHTTDVAAHTKRFVVAVGLLVGAGVVALVGVILQMARIQSGTKDLPVNSKLNHGDIAQVKTMVGASTFAAVTAGPSPTPQTMTVQPATTST
jgi:hypothetical protein